MPSHSLPKLVSRFVLLFLFFDVSLVVASPVSISVDVQVVGGQSSPPPAQPTPPPAQPTPPPAQPTPPPAQPTPLPAQPTPLPAPTSASPTPPASPPSASPTPAPTSAPPPLEPAPADQVLLGGVASGVRSNVDGIPSRSPACVTTECIAYYPVSLRHNHQSLGQATNVDMALVCRCVLLASNRTKYSLSLDRDGSAKGRPCTILNVSSPWPKFSDYQPVRRKPY